MVKRNVMLKSLKFLRRYDVWFEPYVEMIGDEVRYPFSFTFERNKFYTLKDVLEFLKENEKETYEKIMEGIRSTYKKNAEQIEVSKKKLDELFNEPLNILFHDETAVYNRYETRVFAVKGGELIEITEDILNVVEFGALETTYEGKILTRGVDPEDAVPELLEELGYEVKGCYWL